MAIVDAGPPSNPQDAININGISHPAAHPATIGPSGGPSPTSLNGAGVGGAATGVNGVANPANGADLLQQLWGVITELSEQLTQNRAVSVGLFGLAGEIKVIIYLGFCLVDAMRRWRSQGNWLSLAFYFFVLRILLSQC